MNRLHFQHLNFFLKPIYGVEFVIFLVGMWFLVEKLWVLFEVQQVIDVVWKLTEYWKVFG
jgi:hypothetical protein